MRFLFFIIVSIFSVHSYASEWQENADVAELFHEAQVNGTFVLYDVSTGKMTGYNRERAVKQFIPASTFKIPNSMIGLSVGAVQSLDDILPYGGKPQPFKIWEQDMSLRKAIKLSNAAIYQELARRIGMEDMQKLVDKLAFGNTELGSSVDTFWLEGPLKISALEQVEFLARFAQNKLPVSSEIQGIVRNMVLMEQGDGWTLYGKTGWQNAPEPGVGWWVGWVVKDQQIFSFALNLDIQEVADSKKRVAIGKASLKALGVL